MASAPEAWAKFLDAVDPRHKPFLKRNGQAVGCLLVFARIAYHFLAEHSTAAHSTQKEFNSQETYAIHRDAAITPIHIARETPPKALAPIDKTTESSHRPALRKITEW